MTTPAYISYYLHANASPVGIYWAKTGEDAALQASRDSGRPLDEIQARKSTVSDYADLGLPVDAPHGAQCILANYLVKH